MGMVCSPGCRYWTILSRERAVCEEPERWGLYERHGSTPAVCEGDYCAVGHHINERRPEG